MAEAQWHSSTVCSRRLWWAAEARFANFVTAPNSQVHLKVLLAPLSPKFMAAPFFGGRFPPSSQSELGRWSKVTIWVSFVPKRRRRKRKKKKKPRLDLHGEQDNEDEKKEILRLPTPPFARPLEVFPRVATFILEKRRKKIGGMFGSGHKIYARFSRPAAGGNPMLLLLLHAWPPRHVYHRERMVNSSSFQKKETVKWRIFISKDDLAWHSWPL